MDDKAAPARLLLSLEEGIHQKTRLAIMVLLRGEVEVSFSYLRQTLELTDGNLGRHLEALSNSGCVAVRRSYNGRRTQSWIRLTDVGAMKLQSEVDILRAALERLP